MTYMILREVESGGYRELQSGTDLSELQTAHNEYLKTIDPDQLLILRVLPLTITVTYDTSTQSLNTNVHISGT